MGLSHHSFTEERIGKGSAASLLGLAQKRSVCSKLIGSGRARECCILLGGLPGNPERADQHLVTVEQREPAAHQQQPACMDMIEMRHRLADLQRGIQCLARRLEHDRCAGFSARVSPIDVDGPLTLTDQLLMVDAAIDGIGIAFVPDFLAAAALKERRLESVLTTDSALTECGRTPNSMEATMLRRRCKIDHRR